MSDGRPTFQPQMKFPIWYAEIFPRGNYLRIRAPGLVKYGAETYYGSVVELAAVVHSSKLSKVPEYEKLTNTSRHTALPVRLY